MPHVPEHPFGMSESAWTQFETARGYQGPRGNLSYGQLSGLQESGDMGGYLAAEWGLSDEYDKYITGFEQKPFEMMKEAAAQQRGELSAATQSQLRQTYSQEAKAAGKAGFARAGGITSSMNLQKEQLLGGYQEGLGGIQVGLERDFYGEQQRQQERFYDEIGAIKQMQSSGGGGKK